MATTTSNPAANMAPTSAEEIAALFNLVSASGSVTAQQPLQQQQQQPPPQTAEIVLTTSELSDPAVLQQKLSAVLAQLRNCENFGSGADGGSQKIVIRAQPSQQQIAATAPCSVISVVKPEPELQLQHLQLQHQQQQRRVSIITMPTPVIDSSATSVTGISATHSQQMLLLNNKSIISGGSGGNMLLIPLDSAGSFQLQQPPQQQQQVQQPILIPQQPLRQQRQQQQHQPQLKKLVTVRPKLEQVTYSHASSTPSHIDAGGISGFSGLAASSASGISSSASGGISGTPWQQYIKQFTNMGPCPICGDKISGYHYGIFSCESCKGFFKRTVQNRKTYTCHRGSQTACEMSLLSRKKCPACRMRKCLDQGMKVEAIRGDRTRGGRSLYTGMRLQQAAAAPGDCRGVSQTSQTSSSSSSTASSSAQPQLVPLPQPPPPPPPPLTQSAPSQRPSASPETATGLSACIEDALNSERAVMHEEDSLDLTDTASDESAVYRALLVLAERRLYRLVRWSRHLPAFNAVSTEDQIALLQNCWIELLCFDCCWRSLQTPSEIRLTANKCINLEAARELGADSIVREILALTGDLCRIGLSLTEYACLKVIVLMQPEAQDLSCPDKVRACLDDMCQSLMAHTVAACPTEPNKFAELFLKVADLKRTAAAAWTMLAGKNLSPYLESSSLLMELFKSSCLRSGHR